MTQATEMTGIIDKPSNHSFDGTVERLRNILQSKEVTLFAVVDHSGEAHNVGMEMPPTKLLIFGSPKSGTPLMLAAPSIAIDLPLKVLVREDPDRKMWVSYNSPSYLQKRHNLTTGLLENIAVIETLAAKAAEQTVLRSSSTAIGAIRTKCARIEVRVSELKDLSEAIDPSPFRYRGHIPCPIRSYRQYLRPIATPPNSA